MDDEDELLEPGRPAMSRPARIAGAVLLVAVLVAVFAVRFWPSSNPKPQQAVLGTPPPAGSRISDSVPPQQPWPTAPGACGGTTELPLVEAPQPTNAHVGLDGLTLLVGGHELRAVNFDSGRVTDLPTPRLGRRWYVQTLTQVLPAYATTISCRGGAASRLLRIGIDHHVADLGPLRPDQSVIADGTHAWIVTTPNNRKLLATLRPATGGPVVTLPEQTYPAAIENGTVVARGEHGSVVLLDVTTGTVERTVPDAGYPLAAGPGLVVWTSGCDVGSDRPCQLDTLRSVYGRVAHYPLPHPAISATINPDGLQVALLMESTVTNPVSGHPLPPTDIAVLDLHSRRMQLVAGLTIPAKEVPGLAFSADGRWLAIALDGGTRTRLLAWRSDLGHPYETTAVPGRNYGTPPVIALGG